MNETPKRYKHVIEQTAHDAAVYKAYLMGVDIAPDALDVSEKNPIILPKKHLSWSQYDLWNRDKKRYMSQYFENGKKLDTKYLRFGKGIASAIEDGTYKDILPDLHVYEKVEFRIDTVIDGINLLCFLDSYCPLTNVFDEYKTGKRSKTGAPSWDAAKVQKHGQLLFYATALANLTGEMPWHCDLHWLETKEGSDDPDDFWAQADRKLELTGFVKTFRRDFDEREVARMRADIVRVATEISDVYKLFVAEL